MLEYGAVILEYGAVLALAIHAQHVHQRNTIVSTTAPYYHDVTSESSCRLAKHAQLRTSNTMVSTPTFVNSVVIFSGVRPLKFI